MISLVKYKKDAISNCHCEDALPEAISNSVGSLLRTRRSQRHAHDES
jgi:hypothetical protein